MSDSKNPRDWVELDERGRPRLKATVGDTARTSRNGLAGIAATLTAHDVEGGEISGARHLSTAVAAAGLAVGAARKSAVKGFAEGRAAAELDAQAQAQRTVTLTRAHIEPGNLASHLRADLATLAQHPLSALNPKLPMHPRRSASAFDNAFASGGDTVALDLARVGVRTTPNLKAALEDYHQGGRDRLVAAGLVPPLHSLSLNPDRNQDRNAQTQTAHTAPQLTAWAQGAHRDQPAPGAPGRGRGGMEM